MCHHRRDPLQRPHHGILISRNIWRYILIDEVWHKAAQARSLATSISPKNKDSILEARPAPRLQIRKPKLR